MSDDGTHHGLFPFVASTLTRGLHRYLRESCPESALLRKMEGLPEEMARALNADPVLRRMRGHLPLLADYCPDGDSVGDDLARFPGPYPILDDDFTDPFPYWRPRVNRVAGPILQRFVERSVTRDMVCEVLRGSLTPDVVAQIPESPAWIKRFHESEAYILLGDALLGTVEESLTTQNLKATRAAIGPLVALLVQSGEYPQLAESLDKELVEPLFTDRVEQLRDFADLLWDTLFASYDVVIWQAALNWLIRKALAERDHDWVLDSLAGFILNTILSLLDSTREAWGVDPDLNILTVPEAAAFLGIQPSTLHTHINKRKGTPAAAPVELRKIGRGRGTYVVHVEALSEWAEKHIRSRKKTN